jgi:MoaA/NifB/PqqE/SkfB family radical SAM enzyme
VLPWISLEASPIGSVRPCCLAEDEIADDTGEKFDLNSADLARVQDSEYMRRLRRDFLDGKRPRTCRKCWNEERAGRTSKRMYTLDRLKHIVQDEEWTDQSKPLRFLDLKLGNICNLKCRICGSWSSSTFAAEELQYLGRDEEKKQTFHYQMLKRGAWPRENPAFWSEIDRVIDHINYVEFTGGEPFMIKEHFDLLRRMVDRGIASQVEIHYNTNGTQFPLGAEDIWRHFKLVEIAFSIDDVGPRFEYQRTNADWHMVNGHIDLFRDMRSRLGNIELQVCSTVNVFNVMYLEDLAHWIDQQAFDMIYWNMMHEAYYFSIGSLPESAKQAAAERLARAQVTGKHREEFDRIIRFMQGAVSLDGHILRMKVEDLDWKRDQDLRDHHPELAQAIGYDGPKR